MDEFNKSKALEFQKNSLKSKEPAWQQIFGVEISVNDNDLNGIIEDNSNHSMKNISVHLEDLEFGDLL